MTKDQLVKYIKGGESENLELKENFSDSVIEALVAFANGKGGEILVGINNKLNITGVTLSSESVQQWLNEIKNKTYPFLVPEIETIKISGNKLVVRIYIKEVPVKPIAFKGRCYIRRKNSNHIMTTQEIFNQYLKTYNLSWDNLIDKQTKIADLDIIKIEKFVRFMQSRNMSVVAEDTVTVLKKFGLIKDSGDVTFACALLFAKKPLLNSVIHLVRFKNNEKEEAIEDVFVQEDLISEITIVMNFIERNIRKGVKKVSASIKLSNDIVWQYPVDALREIVTNMIVHRDYKASSYAYVHIFDHRIEFGNPGEIPDEITMDRIVNGNYSPVTRNHLITRILKESGVIENFGSGLTKVVRQLKAEGFMDFVIGNFANITRIIINEPANEPVNEPVNEPAKNRQKEIIRLIEKNKTISISELSANCNVGRETIKRDLKKLKEAGILKREGSDKKGYWEILI